MLKITRGFVREWAREYDRRADPRDRADEQALKAWLRGQQDPKHLDKTHFARLARWAAPRQAAAYESNSPVLVRQATRLANQTTDERLKMHVLSALEGVSVMVGAAMLHFFHPRLYPIFDIHDRTTLKKAGFWPRRVDDGSVEAWGSTCASCAGWPAASASACATSIRRFTPTTAGVPAASAPPRPISGGSPRPQVTRTPWSSPPRPVPSTDQERRTVMARPAVHWGSGARSISGEPLADRAAPLILRWVAAQGLRRRFLSRLRFETMREQMENKCRFGQSIPQDSVQRFVARFGLSQKKKKTRRSKGQTPIGLQSARRRGLSYTGRRKEAPRWPSWYET
jgi:hypothetical protein